MIPIALHLENKKILIVGSGKVAQRKIKQYLSENAIITVLTIDDYQNDQVTIIHEGYDTQYLEDMFLVYAATNDLEINHQIVEDCKSRNILCGCASYEEDASFYSMNSVSNEVGMIGISMHQRFPYTKPLLDDLLEVFENNKDRMRYLGLLRQYMLDHHYPIKEYIHKIYPLDPAWIQWIYESIQQEAYVFVYHNTKEKQTIHFNITPSITVSIDEWIELQEYLIFDHKIIVVPLLLTSGMMEKKLINATKVNAKILPALIQTKKDIEELLGLLRTVKNPIYIMHPRSQTTLKKQIQECLLEGERIYTFDEVYPISTDTTLVPLLLLNGSHYQDLLELKVAITKPLLEQNVIINWIESKLVLSK